MGKIKPKEIRFRVYPESVHSFWFDCTIYPTVDAMRKAIKRFNGNLTGNDVRGMVNHFRDMRKGKIITKRIGHIRLYRGDLSAEVLSHESAHAALHWAEWMGINVNDHSADATGFEMSQESGEERFAYALGRICAQMSCMVWKHDLVAIIKDE